MSEKVRELFPNQEAVISVELHANPEYFRVFDPPQDSFEIVGEQGGPFNLTRSSKLAQELELIPQSEGVENEVADQNFYVTANMVLKLTARARELFESSEVDEKRQLLNFVFQNSKLDKKTLLIRTHEPFMAMMQYKQCFNQLEVERIELSSLNNFQVTTTCLVPKKSIGSYAGNPIRTEPSQLISRDAS